jgi:hypothetical protein
MNSNIEILVGEVTIEWKMDKDISPKNTILFSTYVGDSSHFPGVKIRIKTKKSENFNPGNQSWYIYGRAEKINYPKDGDELEHIVVDFAEPNQSGYVTTKTISLAD